MSNSVENIAKSALTASTSNTSSIGTLNTTVGSHTSQLADLMNKQWNDFIQNTPNPWAGTAVNGGTNPGIAGTSKHPGVRSFISSTNANSGYGYTTSGAPIVLGGGEKSTVIIKTATTLTGVTRRTGFHDTSDFNAPTDGVYIKILDGVLTGQAVNNGTISTTGTNYTIAADTWYRLKIELNSDATLATYTLYADDSNTVLWTDTLSTNIPKVVGRETGHGDICSYSSTTAITIGYIDYMDIVLPNARRVV